MFSMFPVPVALDARLDAVAQDAASLIFQLNIALAMSQSEVIQDAGALQEELDRLQHAFAPVVHAYRQRASASLMQASAEYYLVLRDEVTAPLGERDVRARLRARAEERMLQELDSVSLAVCRVWSSEIRDLVNGLRAFVGRASALLAIDQRCAA